MILPEPIGFQWDLGNIDKNYYSHGILNEEIEEVFYDEDKLIFKDIRHSVDEPRFILVGSTFKDKLLYIAFCIRDSEVRVISARKLNKKEMYLYEKKSKSSKI